MTVTGWGQILTSLIKLMDEVQKEHLTLVITKHGVPIAKLIPAEDEPINLYGALKGSIKIKEDIVAPIDEPWEASS